MDILWIILGIILTVAGIAGCVLPFLPGPPLSCAGLLSQQLKSFTPYSTRFLLIWGGVALVVTALDYVIPLYGTKKFGGSKYGVWGTTIGLIVGLFFPPLGLIIGPFIGAFIGELLASNDSNLAFRAAMGSFLGFVLGTLIKLIACLVMAWYLFMSIIHPDQIVS